MRPSHPLWRLVLAALALCMGAPGQARELERVTLQLKWTHAFQFAGYYAAVAKGYYREAGLDVQLLEAAPGTDAVEAVLGGRAQYGVGTSSLLLARKAGKPVVVLAVIFQHSPLVLVARHDASQRGTQGVHDLAGKRVMIEPQSDEIQAYLRQEGITADRFIAVPHSFEAQDLIEGRVDAMSAYVSNEIFALDRAGLPYQVYSPRSGGIDFYGDNLFTTDAELQARPDRVRAFRDASLRGWQYAMRHPAEIIDLILERYAPGQSREFLAFEAERMASLLRTDLIEPGYMHRGRWQHMAETYADLGLLPRGYRLDGLLYEPDVRRDLRAFYVAVLMLAVVSGVALHIFRINRRLARAVAESYAAEERIRHLAQHDPLTDLPNRALFSDLLSQALANARRDGQGLAVMFIDLDHFKPVNDRLGHAVGDHLLQQVAARLRQSLRESDTVARVGGDEFVALLRNVRDAGRALAVAHKVGESMMQPFDVDGHRLALSASLGLATYPQHGQTERELLQHADEAMYRAKRGGPGRVQVYGGTTSGPA